MSDKIYCGNGREIKTRFGTMMKLSFSVSDLERLQSNLENGWVNAVVSEKKNKIDGKPTHYLTIDDWKPTGQAAVQDAGEDDESLPF